MNMLITVPASAAAATISLPAFAANRAADPIFAAIERCRAAEAANLIDPPPPSVADIRPARETLARTRPTTPAGLAALTTFIREQNARYGEFYFEDSNTCAETAVFTSSLDDAVRGMGGLQPWAGIVDPSADPIFVAIDAHRKAYRAFEDVLTRKSELEGRHRDIWQTKFPGFPLRVNEKIAPGVEVPLRVRTQRDVTAFMRALAKAEPKMARAKREKLEATWRTRVRQAARDYKRARAAAGLDAMDRAEEKYGALEIEAANDLLNCRPTTRAGLAAFLDYVVKFQEGRFDGDEMHTALKTAAAAAKALG